MATNGWTPTEGRIMSLLGDGMPHHHSEMRACLNDELAVEQTLSVHLCNIRKRLTGVEIVCRLIGKSRHYQMFRKLADPSLD